MFLQSCLPAQLRDSLLSLFFSCLFPGIHGKTGDWHSWFQWTRRMQSGRRCLLYASSGRKIWETPKSLTTTTSKIKVPPIIFIFCGLQKNISQVSQADRLAAIPPLQCRVCGGNTDFLFFFPWHALYCSILDSSNTGRHLSIEMNQPGESPLAPRIMQQVTGAMFLLFSAVRITQTLTHTGTLIC